jgi:hypothetical protein
MARGGILSLLPAIAGTVAGTMFGMPWLGAAISGIGTAAVTGDVGKGALAGLTSFGLGSLAAGFGNAGAAAGAGTASEALSAVPVAEMGGDMLGNMAGQVAAGGGATNAAINSAGAGSGVMQNLTNIGRGLADPSNYTKVLKDNFQTGVVPTFMGLSGSLGSDEPLGTTNSSNYSYTRNPGRQGRQPVMPGPGYRPGIDPEHRYFADGGIVPQARLEALQGETAAEAKLALMGRHPHPEEALARFSQVNGADALRALMATAQTARRANAIQGPGDGRDDAVPAVIDGREPVMLSTDEHVIPAHAVAAIGRGSSAAGHRRLDAMIDRAGQPIRKAPRLPA